MQGNRHIRHRSDEGYDGRGVVWGQRRSVDLLRGIRNKAGRGGLSPASGGRPGVGRNVRA